MSSIKKVVLAYSGGLDTSAIVPWLKENYGCEVIAFVADVGQGAEELEGVEEKAIAFGLKAVMLKMAWPEEKSTDLIETKLSELENVSSATIEDYRRAFG